MATAAFTHADGSIHDDHPEERRYFLRQHPHTVGRVVADGVAHHEPGRVEAGGDRRGGRMADFAAARVARTGRDPQRDDRFHAPMADRPPFRGPPPFRTGAAAPPSALSRRPSPRGLRGMSQRPAAARRAPGSLSAGAAVARSEGGESAGPRKGAPARAQPGTLARAGRLVADRGRRGLRWTGALSAGGSRALRALALWLALAGAAAAQDLAPCPPGQPPLRLDPAVTASLGARILAIGSSSTSGAGASGPAANYPAQLQARLGGGARVDNAGRGGERAAATLARLRTRLAAEPYDLVIWQVGVNDALGTVDPAAFAATLDAGVATIRAAGATPMLMDQQAFPGMRDPARYARFVALVGAAARRHGVALVPRHAIMAGWDAATLETMLAADRFHMGDRGYGCLAALLAEALSG